MYQIDHRMKMILDRTLYSHTNRIYLNNLSKLFSNFSKKKNNYPIKKSCLPQYVKKHVVKD